MEPFVIAEEPDFLVLDKPAGISVHRGPGVKSAALTDWLIERYPEIARVGDDPAMRPGIVHRLDKDTSGVLLVARTERAFAALKKMFQARAVEKTYLALVSGAPKKRSGIIDEPVGRLASNRTKRGTGPRALNPKPARTAYRILETFPGWTLLEARPKTGRMHQIRVHLASIGCPVAGDPAYGGRRARLLGLNRHFLHAARLAFSYPPGRRWQFESPLPADLQSALKTMRQLKRKPRHDIKDSGQRS